VVEVADVANQTVGNRKPDCPDKTWESPDGAMSAGRDDGRQVDGNEVDIITYYTVSSLS